VSRGNRKLCAGETRQSGNTADFLECTSFLLLVLQGVHGKKHYAVICLTLVHFVKGNKWLR